MTGSAVAKVLIEVGAVNISPEKPFRYTDKIKSPIFIDSQVLLSKPTQRREIVRALMDLAREKYWRFGGLAGTATSGVAWATLLSHQMNVPLAYVHSEAKTFGHRNNIDGTIPPGEKILLVDDLIATGGNAASTVRAVRKAGGEPVGIVGIFSYEMKEAQERFSRLGIQGHSLTDLDSLIRTATRLGALTQETERTITDWGGNPASWKPRKYLNPLG